MIDGESVRVLAVVVTYGARARLCICAARSVLSCGAETVLIVDNGSTERETLVAYADSEPGVRVLHLERNFGSAGGFAAGLRYFLESPLDAVWLFDDDNVATPGALSTAITVLRSSPKTVVACYRPANWAQKAVASGYAIQRVYPGSGSVFNVELFLRAPKTQRIPPSSPLSIPRAPYGGLLMGRDAVEEAGLPREDFVLYADDTEYTERVVARGFHLVLCLEAELIDVDGLSTGMLGVQGLDRLAVGALKQPTRTYYELRNRVFVDYRRARLGKKTPAFTVNLVFFVIRVAVGVARNRAWRGIPLIGRAMVDALRGNLGDSVPLSRVE